MTFLDAQGQPATAPYLEGSRAYLRVVDPGAAGSVAAAISASRSGDYEPLELAETGAGTGVFEGSIELSNDFPSADGLLQTGRDTSQYPWRFDDLNATYAPAMASATAATVGSTVATFDGAGASTISYVVGDTIYLRVTDAFANSTAGIDSAPVNLSTVVGSWGEYQTVVLTETGGDTSTFTGSIQTVPGSAPVQQDGIFEVQPGSGVWVQHDDANGQTYAAVQLSIYPNQPISLAFVDALGQPIATHQEFGWIQLRATDGALAGQWSGLTVRVTSDLRGDEEYVPVYESPFFSGIFTGSVTLQGTLLGSPVANDSILEVSEVAGSPVQRDTIRAEILDCSTAPCPSASCAMTGTTLRITDGQGADLDLIAPPATVSLEALDFSISYDLPTTATVTSGTDAETVTLAPAWQDPENPVFGRFRGVVDVELGAAVPGDGRLQVAASDLLTAERPEPLGLSSATDTAVVGSGLLTFLDRNGDPVDFVVLDGEVRVRAFYPAGNWSSTQADWLSVNLTSREYTGNPRDVESLQLVEIGIDTSTFIGQLPSRAGGPLSPYDGELSTSWIYGPNDTVEVVLDSITATATLRPGILRIVDVSGADLSNIAPGDPVRLHLEAPYADGNPFDPDQVWVRLLSPLSGDEEGLTLIETGAQTGIFTGSFASAIGAATQFDGVIQAQEGESVRAEYLLGYQLAIDEAVMGESNPANTPPNAVDDSVNTADETPVTVNVLSNDSDAEGQFLTVASFTQGAGGTVTGNGGYLTYTPAVGFLGTDTFTYRLVDTQGAEDTATVTVTVEYVNDPPIVYADVATTQEDTAVTIHPLANDSDPEGQALTLDAVFPSTLGVAVITNAAAGTVVYTPNPNANGTDRFSYRVRDAGGATSLAYVDVTIQPVNDPPVAVNDVVTTAEDTLVSVFPRANDSDPDGDEIWISAPWPQAAHGQVGASATMFNYLPAANYNGTDTVAYTINDGNGRTATATVTITITPVPDSPIAVTDNATTVEDVPITVNAKANDSDADGDPLSITAVGTPFHGTATINANGTVTYTPAANFSDIDWFNYTLSDGTGRTANGRINITITPVNDPPDAVDDAFILQEDHVGIWSILANDTDPENNTLSFVSVTQGAHGLVESFVTNIRYTPTANYNGTDTFTYTIRDSFGLTDTATVNVTITPTNDAPTAVADSATTPEDAAVAISVLANDIEPDGDTLSIFTVTQGAHGTVTFNATTATYTPQANFSGTDSFTYTMRDPSSFAGTATVTVTITPVNDPPVAAIDSASTLEDTAVTVNVLGNDSDLEGDALAVTGVTQAIHGAVTFNAGSVTYSPSANYSGADSFTYTIGDGNGGSATASVSITVSASNDAPSAADDAAATAEDTAVTVSVLGNDGDLDGDSLTVTGVTQGANGTVSFNTGSVAYTPAANFNGSDSFTYTIADGHGASATASVSITVSASNDAPSAADDAAATAEDTAVTVSVLGNDGDLDGDSLTVTGVTQGANGTVSFNAGSVAYTPAANFNGSDTFTYTIGDGNGGSATASVSITITPVNDGPSAVADTATTSEDTPVTITVLANDVDVDDDVLVVQSVTQGSLGSVTINTNGTLAYVPNAGTFGTDGFSYTVRDTAGLTATATVSVTVSGVNDPPDAVNDSATIFEASGGVAINALANDTDPDGDTLSVTAVSSPAHGTVSVNPDNTITYVPVASYSGGDSFTYTISDGAATDTATVTVQVKDAIGRVAVLSTHSLWIQTGADVLSGDVITNQVGGSPFLNASSEVSIAGSATTAAGWDVQGNKVTVAAGAVVASDMYSNQLVNSGTVSGAVYSPLALPVFPTLPTFLPSTPGTSDVTVATNGTRVLAPGSYRDLIVNKKGTVTFTGGTYHFRSIILAIEAKLYFSAPSTLRLQQRISSGNLVVIKPGTGSTATAATIVFHVGGINGTTGSGALSANPKPVEIGNDNTISANFYAPNGTLWIRDRAIATGAFFGKDVMVGPDSQVTLSSAW